MKELILLTDGSADAHTKVGYGAYLVLRDQDFSARDVQENIQIRRFEQTSSTKLELQTLLWALNEVKESERKIIVFTDSQNIIRLPNRKERLERTGYYAKNGKRIRHYELYQEFFRLTNEIKYDLHKVKGHMSAQKKDDIDKLFTLVDRASRNALRHENRNGSHSST